MLVVKLNRSVNMGLSKVNQVLKMFFAVFSPVSEKN